MKTLSYQVQIEAPAQRVWDILADFGGVYKYSPGVKSSHSTSANNQGVGATRHCDLLPTGTVEERILKWDEGRLYALEIYEGKGTPPFKSAIATIEVKPTESGSTVFFNFEYGLKYGPIGAVMDAVMVGPFLKKGLGGLLAGLKHYAETGEEVASAKGLQFVAVTG